MALPFETNDLVDSSQVTGGNPTESDVGYGEAALASLKLSAKDAPVFSISRILDVAEKQAEGEKISPEELNNKYGHQGYEFSYPMTESAAQFVIDEKKKRQELEQIISEGPKGVLSTGLNFTAALLPHAVDPLNVAAGAAVGGVVRFAWLAQKGKVGFVAANIAEQFIGNALIEPVSFASAAIEEREYTASQAFVNSMGGAILGTGIKFGGGALFSKLNGKGWTGHLTAHQTALSQLLQGRKVDVSFIKEDLLNETTPIREAPLEKLDIKSEMTGKKFYAATFDKTEVPQRFDSIGDNMGDGLYLTTSKESANGASGSKYSDKLGDVLEFDGIEKKNLIDLDEPISLEIKQALPEFLGNVKENTTLRDVIDDLRDTNREQLNQLNSELQSKGYDGYYHDNRKVLGESGRDENILMLFDKEKVQPSNRYKADRSLVSSVSTEKMLEINKLESVRKDSPFKEYTSDLPKSSQDLLNRPLELDENVSKLDSKMADFEAEIEAYAKDGHISADDMELIKASKQSEVELENSFMEAFRCMAGGLF